ncbi:MAG: response regulator [Pseudomonadota bacterium]
MRMLVANIQVASIGSLGCALVLVWQLGEIAHHPVVWGWLSALICVTSVRVALIHAYRRAVSRITHDFAQWRWGLTVLELVLGTIWGSLGLLEPLIEPSAQMLYAIILAGLAAGGAVTFAAHLPMVYAFIFPSIGLLTYYLFFYVSGSGSAFAAIAMLYGVLMLALARPLNRYIIRTLTAQEENRALITRLKWSNRQTLREVRGHQHTEAVLQNTKDQYEGLVKEYGSMLENMPVGIVKLDKELRITYINTAMENIMGVPTAGQSAALGTVMTMLPSVQAAKIDEFITGLLQEKGFDISGEYTSLYGKKTYLSAKGIPLIKGRQFVGGLLIAQDISVHMRVEQELRVAKQEVLNACRAKSSFLANMSHELRTPLHGILGVVDVLESLITQKEWHEYLRIIRLSGNNLLETVNRVLDLARIESGGFQLEPKNCDIRALMNEQSQLYRDAIIAKGVSFEIDVGPEVPATVMVDDYHLRHTIQNLLHNAYKFTESGSIRLVVRSHYRGENIHSVYFSVQDTGIGIGKEVQQKLFEPLPQGENSFVRRPGLGLGNTIAREMVKRLGGELKLVSTVGQGSTFSFTLVLESGVTIENITPDRAFVERAITARAPMVLVVDDNDVNRLIALKFLQSLSCDVDAVASGAEAISRVRERVYDLVFMDIDMPGMDGVEAAKRMRETGNYRLPIIAMTAHTQDGDRERFLEAGMNDYISKPFDRAVLARMIKKYITILPANRAAD